jgi:hypothetical protein
MAGLDGICPGSLVASIPGLIRFAQLEGHSLKSLHHIVYLHVNGIFSYYDGNFLGACARAGVSSLGIDGMFTTTRICGSESPAGIE